MLTKYGCAVSDIKYFYGHYSVLPGYFRVTAQSDPGLHCCFKEALEETWEKVPSDISAQSDQSLCCPHEETLHPWLFIMRPVITKTHLFKYIENFTTKNRRFADKNSDFFFFHISVQNIDCGYSLEPPRRGGSNEYPQSMFLSRNKKNNVYPCKPQFYYIKVGFKEVKII